MERSDSRAFTALKGLEEYSKAIYRLKRRIENDQVQGIILNAREKREFYIQHMVELENVWTRVRNSVLEATS